MSIKRYQFMAEYINGESQASLFLQDPEGNLAALGDYVAYADYARLKAEVERLKASVRHQKAMLWALEAYTGQLAVDIDPNPWGMRNPHRKNNDCYFDGNPIPKEGKQL